MVRIEIKKVANGQMMLGIEAKKEAPDEVLTWKQSSGQR